MHHWYVNCSIFVAGRDFEGSILRRYIRLPAAATLAALLAGCGETTDETESAAAAARLPTAATLGEQVVLSPTEYLGTPRYATADRSRGERQARLCKACHSFGKDGPNMIGPALHGMFGRQAGTNNGFAYSDVMRDADFVWTPEALNAWLAQPGRFLPGNRMTFAGVLEQSDRDALIAYLLEKTTADH